MYPKLDDEEIKDQRNPLVPNKDAQAKMIINDHITIQKEIIETRKTKDTSKIGEITNWTLPHSSIYLPFTFRGENLYANFCSRVMGLFFVAAYVLILIF